MVNLADLDTSFLVPCRHCGELLPEQDRICPHCGKDQKVGHDKGSANASTRSAGLSPDDADLLDPVASARGASDFTYAGIDSQPADGDGAARRRRQVIGVVALIAGVLLLGLAYDRYVKQGAAKTQPALVQDVPREPARPVTVTGPVVHTPSASAPAPSDAAAATVPPVAADASPSACNEALAALSLCTRP